MSTFHRLSRCVDTTYILLLQLKIWILPPALPDWLLAMGHWEVEQHWNRRAAASHFLVWEWKFVCSDSRAAVETSLCFSVKKHSTESGRFFSTTQQNLCQTRVSTLPGTDKMYCKYLVKSLDKIRIWLLHLFYHIKNIIP